MRHTFLPFVLAMLGAFVVAVFHAAAPERDPIVVDMPDGKRVLAQDVWVENNTCIVAVDDQVINIPAGYRLNRDRDDHAYFTHLRN